MPAPLEYRRKALSYDYLQFSPDNCVYIEVSDCMVALAA